MAGGGQPGFVLARDPVTEKPAWALEMPRRKVAENDAVLDGQLALEDEKVAFDVLCLLYVALTRAKKGLYIITAFPGKSSSLLSPAAFVKQQLAGDQRPIDGKTVSIGGGEFNCLYEAGEPEWYVKAREAKERLPGAAPADLTADFRQRTSQRRRLVHVQPSKRVEIEQRADWLFAPEAQDSLDLGKAIHELFERISWIGEADGDDLVQQWKQATTVREELREGAVERFRRAMALPEIRQALSRPRGEVSLWREKRFEIVLDDRWVSGSFDRVVIVRDEEGKPVRATIFDFKSDEVAGEADMAAVAERYRPQMALYRSALSRMLRLDPARVALRVLFVQTGKVHDLS
jgi:ATP-dependent helicase/nuclease subunit A